MKKLLKPVIFAFLFCNLLYLNASAIFCGPYKKSNPIVYDGAHDITISSLSIWGDSINCISLINCYNIVIDKCLLKNATGNGINLENCSDITITNCRFDNVATGIYALKCQWIVISGNEIRNVQGPLPRGQMVQFNNVTGPGNKIINNKCENFPDESNPEDIINIYMSHGTLTSPIEISGNYIRGGGPSATGGGIMIGDNGGKNILVKDNILINPGQYGIGVASGDSITITGNQILGKKQSFSNVGLYVYNQYPSVCKTISITNNVINYLNATGQQSGFWDKGNCGNIHLRSNNFNANISSLILPPALLSTCPTF